MSIARFLKLQIYTAVFVLLCSTNVSCAKKEAAASEANESKASFEPAGKASEMATIYAIDGGWECLDCLQMAPVLNEAEKKFKDQIKFIRRIKLDSNEAKKLNAYIDDIPNLKPPVYVLFNKEGDYVITFVGSGPKDLVLKQFEALATGRLPQTKPKAVAKVSIPDLDFDHKGLPTLMFHYADWCPYCRQTQPAVKELKAELAGKVFIRELNVDEERSVAAKYRPKPGGIPYFQLFSKDGKYLKEQIGAMPKETIRKIIKDTFGI